MSDESNSAVLGTPHKRKKSEHSDTRFQSPEHTGLLLSPDVGQLANVFMSPTPHVFPPAPGSIEWTPSIGDKVLAEGFSTFPDTTPGRALTYGAQESMVTSPLFPDLMGPSDFDYRTSHFAQNTEALGNRINKRKTEQQSLSSLEDYRNSSSAGTSLLSGNLQGVHSPNFRGSSVFGGGIDAFSGGRLNMAELLSPSRMGNMELGNSQGSSSSGISGIAAITAAAAHVHQGAPIGLSSSSHSAENSPDSADGPGLLTSRGHRVPHSGGKGSSKRGGTSSSSSSRGVKKEKLTVETRGLRGSGDSHMHTSMTPDMKDMSLRGTLLLAKTASCNCKKSKCLKMYCDCFRLSEYCKEGSCHCIECNNNADYDMARLAARKSIQDRNPEAFKPRVKEDQQEHLTGCHCRKSACLKKYCECYNGKVPCSSRCRCVDCQNTGVVQGGTPSAAPPIAMTSGSAGSGGVVQRAQSLPVSSTSSAGVTSSASKQHLQQHYQQYQHGSASGAGGVSLLRAHSTGNNGNGSHNGGSSGGISQLQQQQQQHHRLQHGNNHNNNGGGGMAPVKLFDARPHHNDDHDNDNDRDDEEDKEDDDEEDDYYYHSQDNSRLSVDVSAGPANLGNLGSLGAGGLDSISREMQLRRAPSALSAASAASSAMDVSGSGGGFSFSAPHSPVRSTNNNNGSNGGVLSAVSSPQKLLELADLCEERQQKEMSSSVASDTAESL